MAIGEVNLPVNIPINSGKNGGATDGADVVPEVELTRIPRLEELTGKTTFKDLPLLFPQPFCRNLTFLPFSLFGSLPVFMTGADPVDSEGISIDPTIDPGWIAQLTGGGATLLPRPAAEPLTIGIPQLPPQEVTEQGFGGIPGLGLPSLMRTWGAAFTGLVFTGCVVGLCYLLRQPGLGQRALAFARI